MNANLMMLLPLLMAKNSGKTNGGFGGLSPDTIMKMFSASGGSANADKGNPMAAMLMSLIGGKNMRRQTSDTEITDAASETADENKRSEQIAKPDPEKIFDKDVLNMLKIFIDLKKAENKSVEEGEGV